MSECGDYRYTLGRMWDTTRKTLLWIMLNPSTADHRVNDPTIRRCIGFSKSFGFGSLTVLNLFAYRTPYPSRLWRHQGGIVGPHNNECLHVALMEYTDVVVAWGALAKPAGMARAREVIDSILLHGIEPMCLGRSLQGHPRHPLMLKNAAQREPFSYTSAPGLRR